MMKLGTQTGSLNNHLYSRMTIGAPEPTIGMGATILGWTDRHGATITDVMPHRGATIITVREDKAIRTDKNGMSESQSYLFEPNPNGATKQFRKNKNGGWDEVTYNIDTGRFNKVEGAGLRVGERAEYYDFSF